MTQPALSIVIASLNGDAHLRRCLEVLAERCPDAEVVVAEWRSEADSTPPPPGVRVLSFDEPATIPELRAAGIAASAAPHVAVIEDHCLVAEEWGERILAAHAEGHEVVGGSIRNAATHRIRDWAAFFCEYNEHMEPAPAGTVPTLPGMNVSYSRPALEAIADLLAEGRWETFLHPQLRSSGFELYCDPAIVVDHVKEFGVREFASQRWHYSRSHAGMRNGELGWKRAVYLGGAPLLLPLLSWRIARNVLQRRRHGREFALAAPLVAFYVAVWAAGEAVGYALGGGRSLLKVR